MSLPKGRVLVVDDSASMRHQVAEVAQQLEEVGQVEAVADGFAALQSMRIRTPDIVVCDVAMPRCDGLQFLRLRSQSPSLGASPVLVLTSCVDLSMRLALFEAGAADYVQKPWDRRELQARLRVHLRAKLQRDELTRVNAQLEELTCRDPLTAVHNRRHFDSAVSVELGRVDRGGDPLSLILLDLDHFKQVNDTLGHAQGDAVLRAAAAVLGRSVRATDVVSRYGGEEFAVLLPATGAPGARVLAERLRARLSTYVFPEAPSLKVTASLGVATALPGAERLDAGLLVRRADAALYEAKRTGRNCVRSYGDLKRAQRLDGGDRPTS